MKKEISRQRKWQLKQRRKGLCTKCTAKAVNGHYCMHHLFINRRLARNYYRLKVGIPLKAPLHTRAK